MLADRSVSALNAVTDTGVRWMFSSVRRAVTVISSPAMTSSTSADATTSWAWAPIDPNTAEANASDENVRSNFLLTTVCLPVHLACAPFSELLLVP